MCIRDSHSSDRGDHHRGGRWWLLPIDGLGRQFRSLPQLIAADQYYGSPDGSVIGHMGSLRDIMARRVVGAVEVSPFPNLADHGLGGCWFGGTCGALGG